MTDAPQLTQHEAGRAVASGVYDSSRAVSTDAKPFLNRDVVLGAKAVSITVRGIYAPIFAQADLRSGESDAVTIIGVPVLADKKLVEEFNRRADRWERESRIHSSPGEKFLHPDYQFIIGKGEHVVPLILNRLEKSKCDWLWALEHIVGEEENPAKGVESYGGAVRAWREWGKLKYRSRT